MPKADKADVEKVSVVLWTKIKNLEKRPLEINFAEGSQRIEPRSYAFIEEAKLAKDTSAKAQLDFYISNKIVKVVSTGLTTKE